MEKLVLCVDRDNDLGEKAGVVGPIVGVKANLLAAQALALKDPEDTDVNAVFEAVKTAQELGAEVVTLTGDKRVGVVSDIKITKQLEDIIRKLKPDGIILITDGAEDEQILPIIESRVKIISIKTVIVRQSRELEKAYFTALHFMKEIEEDPNLARLVFGIPGLILLFLAIGGILDVMFQAMTLILAIIGGYLIIKGFGYEEDVFSRISSFLSSMSLERASTLTYMIALIPLILGLLAGLDTYDDTKPIGFEFIASAFIIGSADMVLIAVIVVIIGHIIDDYRSGKYLNIRRDLMIFAFLFLLVIAVKSGAKFLLNEIGLYEFGRYDFALELILGIVIFVFMIIFTKYMFIEEIRARRKLIDRFQGEDVYDENNHKVGRISKVLLDGTTLAGIKVGRKKITMDNILSIEEGRILVKAA
ncbi:MAG: DUF373 family protein [Candidatus Altiarchaeales archaeon]|nr:DUF373 family protein [Candidatus Altiarchaeales archaeon]